MTTSSPNVSFILPTIILLRSLISPGVRGFSLSISCLALSPVPVSRLRIAMSRREQHRDSLGSRRWNGSRLTDDEIHLVRPFLLEPVKGHVDERHGRIAIPIRCIHRYGKVEIRADSISPAKSSSFWRAAYDVRRACPPLARQLLVFVIIVVFPESLAFLALLSLLLLFGFPVTSRIKGRPCRIKRVGMEIGNVQEPPGQSYRKKGLSISDGEASGMSPGRSRSRQGWGQGSPRG